MRPRLLPFTALLLIGLPSLPRSAAAADTTGEDITAFAQSSYAYCDAKVLSSLWKTSIYESKAVIGRKLRTGSAPTVEANLTRARADALANPAKRCTLPETGFTPADADKLAKLWKVPLAQAKSVVEQKVTAGNAAAIRAQLGQSAPDPGAAEDVRAFGTSGFTYCDAKVVSKHWQQSVNESKALIGRKLRTNNKPALDAAMSRARTDALKDPSRRCQLPETGFSYADAEKLAKVWKTSVVEAKTRIEQKATAGGSSVVRDLLARGPSGK